MPASRSFAVLPADWAKLLGGSSVVHGFFSPYAHLRARTATSPASGAKLNSAAPVLAASQKLGLDVVLRMVCSTAGGSVDADVPLMDAGVDSLGAVELRTKLQSASATETILPIPDSAPGLASGPIGEACCAFIDQSSRDGAPTGA